MADIGELLLVVRRPCDECDGRGEGPSEAWRRYREAMRADGEQETPASVEHYFLEVEGHASVPPMREECERCHGHGRVSDELAVEEFTRFVLQRVPKGVLSRDDLAPIVRSVKASITAAASKSQGLADPDNASSFLRVVQEGAEALRALAETIVDGER